MDERSYNPRIQFAHSVDEKDYFDFKMKSLENIMPSSETCNGNTYRAQSHTTQCLKPLYDLTITVGKKVITPSWIDAMTEPISLALWFMDSGSVGGGDANSCRNITLTVGDASNNECLILQKWLKDRWNIESHIYIKSRTHGEMVRYTINIMKKESVTIFYNIITSYLVPSKQRKINKLLPRYRGITIPYKCEQCGKEFEKSQEYASHVGLEHPKLGVVRYQFTKEDNPWNNLTDEEHVARSEMIRSSKFAHLDNITITDLQKQMIFGSLLGDMCIWKQRSGVRCRMARPELRISHSTKQRDYVMWKYEILKNIARKEPYEFIQKTGFGAGFGSCRFETRSLNCLEPIYSVVIGKDGKKHVTQEWLDQITNPIALATWYMDDGSKGSGFRIKPWFAMGLATEQEVNIVQEWLRNTWGIETNYNRATGYYNDNTYAILSITLGYREKFIQLIKPYIIPTMEYKINPLVHYNDR